METEGDSIKEILELTRENNKILQGMRNAARLARVWFIVRWVAIIVLAFIGYRFIQPYLDTLVKTYDSLVKGINDVRAATDQIPTFSEFFKRQ
jgi:hypothetical protein